MEIDTSLEQEPSFPLLPYPALHLPTLFLCCSLNHFHVFVLSLSHFIIFYFVRFCHFPSFFLSIVHDVHLEKSICYGCEPETMTATCFHLKNCCHKNLPTLPIFNSLLPSRSDHYTKVCVCGGGRFPFLTLKIILPS